MRGAMLVLGLSALAGGCNCRPTIPPPNPTDPETETTGETAETADTAPEPPCSVPEVEPNNSVNEPTVLPFEAQACGVIGAPLDLDYWAFTHEGTWVEVEIDAAQNAFTDPTFILTPASGEWSALRDDDPESVNATLRFPAPPGEYVLAVNDQDFNGGERYGYDLRVSEAKPPVEWNRTEVEGNDHFASAETAVSGDRIYGTTNNPSALPDLDFYVVQIPPGKHRLVLDIDAFDGGSGADLTFLLYDASFAYLPENCSPCAFQGGVAGLELDPFGEYDSPGSEIVYIHVFEARGLDGPANWYVLSIDLEDG